MRILLSNQKANSLAFKSSEIGGALIFCNYDSATKSQGTAIVIAPGLCLQFLAVKHNKTQSAVCFSAENNHKEEKSFNDTPEFLLLEG